MLYIDIVLYIVIDCVIFINWFFFFGKWFKILFVLIFVYIFFSLKVGFNLIYELNNYLFLYCLYKDF